MQLPQAFLQRMEAKADFDFPAFLRSYDAPPQKAIRVNTLKLSPAEFEKISPFALSPVPWEESGFYVEEEKVGAHPYHFAGLFYSQEPSAMCAAPLLQAKEGERVIDLCAAPGGKTTRLAQGMQGEGILFANEFIFDRAKILSQNVERLGVKNAVVTSADTGAIAKALPAFFDKVLVDAPCSGEGMFKKEPNAIPEWSEENVRRCAERQAEILDNAAQLLSEGGLLAYSTCTFSDEENGLQIEAFLRRHPQFSLVKEETLYPHQVRGEGHFCALMRCIEGVKRSYKSFPVRTDKKAEKAFYDFASDFFAGEIPFRGQFTLLPDGRAYLLPEGLPFHSLRTLRAGVELGEWDGKLFKPSHALAMCCKKGEVQRFVSLSLTECEKYLKGETVESDVKNGWCVVGVEDFPLGIGKAVNGTVKNHLPKGLRKVH